MADRLMQCPGCWTYGACPTHTAGGLRLDYECPCGEAMKIVDLREPRIWEAAMDPGGDLRRVARAAGAALERVEVADDVSGAADEAAAILRQVVTLDGTIVPRDTGGR